MVKLENITFKLPNGLEIIKNFNAEIKQGEFVILLGGNGSGKSSLIKLINRHYIPSAGHIIFDGKEAKKYSESEYNISIITLTQFVKDSLFFDLTIEENAMMIARAYDPSLRKSFNKKLFRNELQRYLGEFNDKLAGSLKEPLNNLSGGEQQILAFTLYLKHQPKLLLLDEHTSALDPKTAERIMKFTDHIINERNLTCIMTTHNLDFAIDYGNRVLALNDGKLVYDSHADGGSIDRQSLLQKCY